MNPKFYSLSDEKKRDITNAALEIFALYGYKKGNTNDIAAKAGISKGLLFFYFENKKGLYTFLYDHAIKIVEEQVQDQLLAEKIDFFEMLKNVQNTKMKTMKVYPYLYSFIIGAYYDETSEIGSLIGDYNQKKIVSSMGHILEKIDVSKFKNNVDPQQVFKLVVWSAEGFMREKIKNNMTDLDDLNTEYEVCLNMMRDNFYKEETNDDRDQ